MQILFISFMLFLTTSINIHWRTHKYACVILPSLAVCPWIYFPFIIHPYYYCGLSHKSLFAMDLEMAITLQAASTAPPRNESVSRGVDGPDSAMRRLVEASGSLIRSVPGLHRSNPTNGYSKSWMVPLSNDDWILPMLPMLPQSSQWQISAATAI